jgi:UDP-2,4-diacetamido-2,4,6-trideoxy-beta-L-altropyranose hydrolase
MRTLFRVDASAYMGGGHLVRCLSLASELRELGAHFEFAVCSEATSTIPWFGKAGFRITCIPDDVLGDEVAEARFIGKTCGNVDTVVVDHYERGYDFERAARDWAGLVVAIEDIPGRVHDADVILDPTFGRSPAEYASVATKAEVLAGADYTLLRHAFAEARVEAVNKRAHQQGRIARVLVAFGASDPENYTGRALEQLTALPEIEIDVLIGGLHPQAQYLSSLTQASGARLRLWQDREDIERLMLECDLAIGGAGGQSWERCCLGLPCLLVEMAPNQRDVAAAIVDNGAGILLGAGLESMSQNLIVAMKDLMVNPQKMIALSSTAFALCDGMGAQRAAKSLLQLSERKLLKGNKE